MNAEQIRREIFSLMLKQEQTENLDEFVAIQFEIEAKIEPYSRWLTERGGETQESDSD